MGTKKLNEKTTVDSLANTEYLLGVAADGSIIKIEKQKAYQVATTAANGLMSASDKAMFPIKKQSALASVTYLIGESISAQAAMSFLVDMTRIEGAYGNLFYVTGSTSSFGTLYNKVNKIIRNSNYEISFFYKKVGSVLSLYVTFAQYHVLTIVPLSVHNFKIRMEQITLPSDAIEIPIE